MNGVVSCDKVRMKDLERTLGITSSSPFTLPMMRLGSKQLKGLAQGDTFPRCQSLQAPSQVLSTAPWSGLVRAPSTPPPSVLGFSHECAVLTLCFGAKNRRKCQNSSLSATLSVEKTQRKWRGCPCRGCNITRLWF